MSELNPLIERKRKSSYDFIAQTLMQICNCIEIKQETQTKGELLVASISKKDNAIQTERKELRQASLEESKVQKRKQTQIKTDTCLIRTYPIDRTQLFGQGNDRLFAKFTIADIKIPQKILIENEIKDAENLWESRFFVFHKFDQGIQVDNKNLHEITHENIAKYIANKCHNYQVIIDAFSGYGGNAIQFAQHCKVIAIEIDPRKIEEAKKIATIYGVEDNITWINGDYFQEITKLKGDLIFLNPPLGDPEFLFQKVYDLEQMIQLSKTSQRSNQSSSCIQEILQLAAQVTKNIWLYLPRNIDPLQCFKIANQLNSLPPLIQFEQYFYKKELKDISLIFGNSCQISFKECTNILASRLNESGQPQKEIIYNLLEKVGPRHCIQMLTKTEEVQQNGGINVSTGGERKKTKGGVFFHIIRTETNIDWKKEINPQIKKKEKKIKFPKEKWNKADFLPHNEIPDSPIMTERMHSRLKNYDLKVTRQSSGEESPSNYEDSNQNCT